MIPVPGNDIGRQICDALGLNSKYIREIHIHIAPDDIVIVETKQYLYKGQFNDLLEVFKSYSLVENESIEPAKFKVGDRVKIPKIKSVGLPREESAAIHTAIRKQQDFLYVNNIDGSMIGVWYTINTVNCDYFLNTDLEIYDTNENEEDCRNNAS